MAAAKQDDAYPNQFGASPATPPPAPARATVPFEAPLAPEMGGGSVTLQMPAPAAAADAYPAPFGGTPPRSLLEQQATDPAQWASAAGHGLVGGTGLGLLYDLSNLPRNQLAWMLGENAPSWLKTKSAREWTGAGLEAAGLPGEPAPTLINRAVEGTTAALTPASLLGLLGKVATAGRKVAAPVVEKLAERPLLQGVAGTGAGVGANAAETYAPDSKLAAIALPLLGAFAGGGIGAGTTAAARMALRKVDPEAAVKAAGTMLSRAGDKADAINRMLGYRPDPEDLPLAPGELGPPAPNRVAQMGNLRTTAEIIDQPGVASSEMAIRNRQDPTGTFVNREAARAEARGHVLDSIAPGADPAAARTALEQTAAAGTQAVQDARAAVGTPAHVEDVGARLRTEFDSRRAASSANVGQLRAAVDPAGTTAIDTNPIVNAIGTSARANSEPLESLTGPHMDILRSGQATFDQLQTIRSRLLSDANDLFRSGGSSARARVLQDAAHAIENRLGTAAARGEGFAPDQLDRWNTFRTAAREHADNYQEDVGAKLTRRDYARPDVAAPLIPDMYFQPGPRGAATMGEFGRVFGDATGTGLMQEHIAAKIGPYLDPQTGQLNAHAYSKFLADYGPAIRQLPPATQAKLTNLQAASRFAQQTGSEAVTPAQHTRNVAQAVLGNENMGDAINRVLRADNPVVGMRELADRVSTRTVGGGLGAVTVSGGNQAGREGLKRGILDNWGQVIESVMPTGAGDTGATQYANALKWWERNKPALAQVFDRDEMARLEAVSRDMFSSRKVAARQVPVGSQTEPTRTAGDLLHETMTGGGGGEQTTAGRGARAALLALPGAKTLVEEFARRPTRDQASLLLDFARDPEVFAAMLRKQSPETLAELAGLVERKGLLGRSGAALRRGAGPMTLPSALSTMGQP